MFRFFYENQLTIYLASPDRQTDPWTGDQRMRHPIRNFTKGRSDGLTISV